MSKFYTINSQNKFKVHSVPDKDTYDHNISDIGRLIYSKSNQRLCIGTTNQWINVATPYDILDQNTKALFGSYPLPTGWNLDTTHTDKAILFTNDDSKIGDVTGDWVISGMSESGSHSHTVGTPTSYIYHRSSGYYDLATYNHIHTVSSDGGHEHSMGGSWRPYHIKYCIAEYQ